MTDLSPMQKIVHEKRELRRKMLTYLTGQIQHYCQDFTEKTGIPVNYLAFEFTASNAISSEKPKANILTNINIGTEGF